MLEAMSWSLRRNSNLAICTYSRFDLFTLDSRTLCAQKPLELTLVQLCASVFTQCAYLFCYIASECSGYGGEFIRSQKTHLQSQKKESFAGAFHPSPPLPEDFINVSSNQTFDATSSPCLLPCRRLFESCSENIEQFNPCFKTGWMLSKHFWTKMIWNLCVCHAMSITHILQNASNLKK